MAGFWSRGDELSALEERLRAGRPQPGVELERAIGQRVGRRSRSGGRALLALALTAGVFGAMASFGGVGYAVSSVRSAVGPGAREHPLWRSVRIRAVHRVREPARQDDPAGRPDASTTGQAGAVYVHITGKGDFEIVPTDGRLTQTCLVPPPPK
jgi:hypothetical protein